MPGKGGSNNKPKGHGGQGDPNRPSRADRPSRDPEHGPDPARGQSP